MTRTSAATFRKAIPVFAALGDEQRLALVRRLSVDGPCSVAALTEEAGITRQGVSKHLRVLNEAGLVSSTKRGRERIYTLASGRLLAAQRALDAISAEWDASLERLEKFVAG